MPNWKSPAGSFGRTILATLWNARIDGMAGFNDWFREQAKSHTDMEITDAEIELFIDDARHFFDKQPNDEPRPNDDEAWGGRPTPRDRILREAEPKPGQEYNASMIVRYLIATVYLVGFILLGRWISYQTELYSGVNMGWENHVLILLVIFMFGLIPMRKFARWLCIRVGIKY